VILFKKMRLVLVGLNHKTAPVEVRENLYFENSSLGAGLDDLRQKAGIRECAILSTCNRVEVYSVTENEDGIEEITQFLSEFHGVPTRHFAPYLYVLTRNAVTRHMLRVTSSLDSMVVGEPQILGQVKDAYRMAVGKKTTGPILNRLFNHAFFVAKRVRAETGIGHYTTSVSHAAVELAKRIFDDLPGRRVMLIGAGGMGKHALTHLVAAGVRDLIVANRTIGRAQEITEKLGGRAIRIEEAYNYLKESDIVITATGSNDFIIKPQNVLDALKLRRNEPMFMIDIGVPRDVDPRVGELENVYLYDIDDLQGVVVETSKIRHVHLEKAEEIILQGDTGFHQWLEGLKAVPTIISIRRRFNEIKCIEVEKALKRLGNISEREREIIEGMASAIIGKILHHPVTRLKTEASKLTGDIYADTIREIFNLDEPSKLQEYCVVNSENEV
jgi:glutamyl-tRNA reductase